MTKENDTWYYKYEQLRKARHKKLEKALKKIKEQQNIINSFLKEIDNLKNEKRKWQDIEERLI